MVGCKSTDYSKNMRAATLSASGTVGVKALLNGVDIEKYPTVQKEVVEVCTAVKEFLKTGELYKLPFDKAKAEVQKFMESKGWGVYIPAVIGIIDLVETQKVPVGSLVGPDNVAIVAIGLDSMIVSAETSRLEWRRPAAIPAAAIPNSVRVYRK